MMTMSSKSYLESLEFKTFEEKFEYLKLNGAVGDATFGTARYLNQKFYTSNEWRNLRHEIIVRDEGCDLGSKDRPIEGKILIHHINPISVEDILNRDPKLFDPNNLICVSEITHNALHYGDESLLSKNPIERRANDTCPWKKT